MFLAACGSGGSATPTTTTVAAATTAPAATTTLATTTTTAAPTSAAPTATTEFTPEDLPGQILMQGVGCGSKLSEEDRAQIAGSQSVGEATEMIRNTGIFSSVPQICVLNLDGSDPVPVSPAGKFAISPGWIEGGKRIVFRMEGQWHVVNPDGSNLQPWTDPTNLVWRLSPDGTQYINQSLHDPHVYVTPVGQEREGPGRRMILDEAFGDTFRWSPDGRFVLFHKGPGECPALWKVDVTTLEQVALTGPKSPSGANGFCSAPGTESWSPGGSAIMVSDYDGLRPDTHPYLVDVDGANLRPLVSGDLFDDPEWFAQGAVWSPDGKYAMVDVVSVEAYLKQAPTRVIVRVADGLVKPINWISPAVIVQLMWGPDVPELKPDPDEDMDAV